jgi:hypothetical protein
MAPIDGITSQSSLKYSEFFDRPFTLHTYSGDSINAQIYNPLTSEVEINYNDLTNNSNSIQINV